MNVNKPYKRTQRVASTLRKLISSVIEYETDDDRLKNITITEVELSRDLKHAKVYFSTQLSNFSSDEALIILNKSKGFISKKTFEKIQLRVIPILDFIYDKSIEDGFNIDNILRQIKDE